MSNPIDNSEDWAKTNDVLRRLNIKDRRTLESWKIRSRKAGRRTIYWNLNDLVKHFENRTTNKDYVAEEKRRQRRSKQNYSDATKIAKRRLAQARSEESPKVSKLRGKIFDHMVGQEFYLDDEEKMERK